MVENSTNEQASSEKTKENLVDVLKKARGQGVSSPDNLGEEVGKLMEAWLDGFADETEKSFLRSVVYFDAGFDDPVWLEELVDEWLVQDLDNAEAEGNVDLVERIGQKMEEIERVLGR